MRENEMHFAGAKRSSERDAVAVALKLRCATAAVSLVKVEAGQAGRHLPPLHRVRGRRAGSSSARVLICVVCHYPPPNRMHPETRCTARKMEFAPIKYSDRIDSHSADAQNRFGRAPCAPLDNCSTNEKIFLIEIAKINLLRMRRFSQCQ
jgi:hypothetical protein